MDPNQVIIDSIVLDYFGLGLKRMGSFDEKLKHTIKIHSTLTQFMNTLLNSEKGQKAIHNFDFLMPGTNLTSMKKLDLMLYTKIVKEE